MTEFKHAALFEKSAALLDSDTEGEFIGAARGMKRIANGAGLLVIEAIAMVFGGAVDPTGVKQKLHVAEARITQLETALQKAEGKLEAFMKRQAVVQNGGYRNISELRTYLWDMPQIRLLMVMLLEVFRYVILPVTGKATEMPHEAYKGFYWMATIAEVMTFWSWTAVEFRDIGIVRIAWKWIMFFVGNGMAIYVLAGVVGLDFDTHFHHPTNATRIAALVIWTATYLACISHLCNWLPTKIRERVWESEVVKKIRERF